MGRDSVRGAERWLEIKRETHMRRRNRCLRNKNNLHGMPKTAHILIICHTIYKIYFACPVSVHVYALYTAVHHMQKVVKTLIGSTSVLVCNAKVSFNFGNNSDVKLFSLLVALPQKLNLHAHIPFSFLLSSFQFVIVVAVTVASV